MTDSMRNSVASDLDNLLKAVIDAQIDPAQRLTQHQLKSIALILVGIQAGSDVRESLGVSPRKRPRGRPQKDGVLRFIVLSFLICRRVQPDTKLDALYLAVARAWSTSEAYVKKVMTARQYAGLRQNAARDFETWGMDTAKATVTKILQVYRRGSAAGTKKH